MDLAVFAPLLRETPLRLLIGVPFLFFLPGYVAVTALVPEANRPEQNDSSEFDQTGLNPGRPLTGMERLVLSFGTNLVIVPLLALPLAWTPVGIRPRPVVVLLSVFIIILAAVGTLRRLSLPASERYSVPYGEWMESLRREGSTEDPKRLGVNLLIVLGLIVSAGAVWYVGAAPEEESFTEFYLVTETDDGEYVLGGYPTNFSLGQSRSLTVAIANHDDRARTYTVVVLLQNVTVSDDTVRVRAEEEQTRFTMRVAKDAVVRPSVSIEPTMTGENLRLTFLLYVGDPPDSSATPPSKHTLHLWIDVAKTAENRTASAVTRPASGLGDHSHSPSGPEASGESTNRFPGVQNPPDTAGLGHWVGGGFT